jgi:hypothetical protein
MMKKVMKLLVITLLTFPLLSISKKRNGIISPYYREGRNHAEVIDKCFVGTATGDLFKTFVSENPSSRSFKQAFNHFQDFIDGFYEEGLNGVHQGDELSLFILRALTYIAGANDMAHALNQVGIYLKTNAHLTRNIRLERFETASCRQVFTLSPEVHSADYKKSYQLCQTLLDALINCGAGKISSKKAKAKFIESIQSYESLMDRAMLNDSMNEPVTAENDPVFNDCCTQAGCQAQRNVWAGVHDCFASFPYDEKLKKITNKQAALFTKSFIKILNVLFMMPKKYHDKQLPEVFNTIGQILINTSTKLKRLS